MFYQNKKGLYVYQSNDDFIVKHLYFDNFNALFQYYGDQVAKNHFGCDLFRNLNREDRYCYSFYTLVLYDENGSFYTPETILGLYREWRANRRNYWKRCDEENAHNKRHGAKLKAWRTTYRSRIYRDLKALHAHDEENYVRCRNKLKLRIMCGLYEYDYPEYRTFEKSWKRQSKRKRQYKNHD